jgi:hypothetical protein
MDRVYLLAMVLPFLSTGNRRKRPLANAPPVREFSTAGVHDLPKSSSAGARLSGFSVLPEPRPEEGGFTGYIWAECHALGR